MGKITGFLEYQRLHEASEDKEARKKHYREFVLHLSDEDAKVQGARCMDCGVPFCMNGCPVNNIIPDFNDLVFKQDWKNAIETLHSTNNFPEFTGRVCPAPCEEACTLRINNDAVGIKSIEHAIIDKAWEQGWVKPRPAATKTGKRVAVIGSGPAGLASAQQLARAGHGVVVFEKNDRVGGLLRYGIPDFKLEKSNIDRRIEQMRAEGVEFRTNHGVGKAPAGAGNAVPKWLEPAAVVGEFDAVILAGGAEQPRDLPVPGRELAGVHFAMEFLPLQNRRVAGDEGVADPERPTVDEHGRNGAAAFVEVGFDDDTFGRTFAGRLQVQDLGLQQDGFQQFVDALAGFRRHMPEHVAAAPLLGDDLVLGQLGPDALSSDEMMETLKLCVSCKACRQKRGR